MRARRPRPRRPRVEQARRHAAPASIAAHPLAVRRARSAQPRRRVQLGGRRRLVGDDARWRARARSPGRASPRRARGRRTACWPRACAPGGGGTSSRSACTARTSTPLRSALRRVASTARSLDVDREDRLPAQPRGGDREHARRRSRGRRSRRRARARAAARGVIRVVGCAPVPNAPSSGSITISGSPSVPGGSSGERTRSRPATFHACPTRAAALLAASGTSSSSRASSAVARERVELRAGERRRRRTPPRRGRRRGRARRRPAGAAASARRARPRPRRPAASAPCASRQPRLAARSAHHEPVALEPGERALAPLLRQRRAAPRPPRARRAAARAPSGRCPRSARRAAVPAGAIACGPAQPACSGHSPQQRTPRPADGRAELHHRLVPRRGPAVGQQLRRAPGERPRRPPHAVAPLDHAPDVGVDRRHLRAERERAERRRRVRPDAGQILEALAGQPCSATSAAAARSASARRL